MPQEPITPTQQYNYGPNDILALMQNMDKQNVPLNDQIANLAKIQPGYGNMDATKYAQFRKEVGLPLQGHIEQAQSLKDKIIEFARPVVAPIVGGVTGAAAAPTGPVGAGVAGTGMAYMVDQALQAAEDRKPVSPLLSLTGGGNTAEMLATNELGGMLGNKVLGGLSNVLKEVGLPGSVTGSISRLQPTFSQLYRNTFGEGAVSGVSKWVEDIFASGAKARAIEQSGKLGMFEGTALAAKTSGRTAAGVSNPLWMAKQAQVSAENNIAQSYLESDGLASTAKLVAKANPLQIAPGVNVEGPINLKNTAMIAKQFLDERTKLFPDITKAPPEDQQLMYAAKRLLEVSQPMFDPQSGQIIRTTPVSFEDAWNFKKATDRFAYGDPQDSISYTSSTFGKISKAINSDIDTSIPMWQNNPNGTATKAWQNAKATVAQRLNTFGEDGVKQLINTVNSPVPEVDKILGDPLKLQRALNAGELKMPSGNVASSNMRRDLQGYKVMTMLQDAWKGDPIDPTKGTIQPEKLLGTWNDPQWGESKKLLFSQQQRADIDQFFKEIAITQQKQTFSGMGSKNMMMVRGGVILAPALVSGALTGASNYTMDAVGITIGGAAVAKLLTNPTTARLMVALASNQPLGRSMEYVSKSIVGALQGTGAVISMNNREGKKIDGTINKSGDFVPQQ